MSNTRYTPEFKDEAVKQMTERGYSISEVSERLGILTHSLYKWVKAVTPDKSGEIADELRQAKQEILRLKAEPPYSRWARHLKKGRKVLRQPQRVKYCL